MEDELCILTVSSILFHVTLKQLEVTKSFFKKSISSQPLQNKNYFYFFVSFLPVFVWRVFI